MKRITKLDSFDSGLCQEIDWCKQQSHRGAPGGKFKAGFLAGMCCAARLLDEVKRLSVVSTAKPTYRTNKSELEEQ
jgi:4'-phosphopantetheinyl transferase EntD